MDVKNALEAGENNRKQCASDFQKQKDHPDSVAVRSHCAPQVTLPCCHAGDVTIYVTVWWAGSRPVSSRRNVNV